MKKDTSDSGGRLSVEQSIELTAQSLNAYLPNYDTAVFTFSGGKDSTATVIVAEHLFNTGQVKRPKNLICIYADTRMELPPLQIAAKETMTELAKRGWDCRTAVADLDNRFLVYMLGRGVAPPTNHFRWCTDRIKLAPMSKALKDVREGLGAGEKILMVTGVRQGESAVRDERIATSCSSKNGSECGQGWFQTMTDDRTDTVAPILHWRVCKIWDFLHFDAPTLGFPSASMVSQAYGGDERLEENARTGCVGCPIVARDLALEGVIALPEWAYLASLTSMKSLFKEWREHHNRLQKPGFEVHKKGIEYTNRKGPLTLEARRKGLADVLAIQSDINAAAKQQGRPLVDMLNEEEVARIEELIAANTWPRKWDGTEPNGAELMPTYYKDGSAQLVLAL